MDEQARVREIYQRLQRESANWEPTSLSYFKGEPFKALIAAMLSAQTREEQTTAAANRLFALADNPFDMLKLIDEQIYEAIQNVQYAEPKVGYVRDIAERVAANGGKVPETVEELVEYRGVGWKVAVLTLAVGYGRTEDITVDVHVARIGKRLGLVNPATKQPPKVNEELKRILPRDMWPHWNALMVQFGRNVCLPTYPRCPKCPLNDLCPKIGVDRVSTR
ncbi:MAG: endonuclease III [Chloroflexota bacterium]|nr:MAG: endonuclease III [Chloroflexota bacterium]